MIFTKSKISVIIIIILAFTIVSANFSTNITFAKKSKKSSLTKSKNIKNSKKIKASKSAKKKTSAKKSTKKEKPSRKKNKSKKDDSLPVYKGKSSGINDRQRELDDINNTINETRKQINALKRNEKSTINNLNDNKKKSSTVARKIEQLESKIRMLQDSIKSMQSTHQKLTNKLSNIQSDYANLASSIYLNDISSPPDYINTNNNSDELSLKNSTIQLTDKLNHKAEHINFQRDSISGKTRQLKEISQEQANIKNQKVKEKITLKKTIAKNEKELNKIKKDQEQLNKLLAEKQRSAKKLKSIINELVRKEIEKQKSKEKTTTSKEKSSTKSNYKEYEHHTSSKSSAHVGRISWPIAGHNILRNYGASKNQSTNTIFDNPGVDISAKSGTPVAAVANGTVSLIHWLPGYGTLIIINHGDGIRSVYANLSSVNVKKDDEIRQGKIIGRTGKSIDGEFLHFELWSGSNRLNPMSYLH